MANIAKFAYLLREHKTEPWVERGDKQKGVCEVSGCVKVGSPSSNSETPSNDISRKSLNVAYLNNGVELSAQTLPTRSTHEYFDYWEYEILTPSELEDRQHNVILFSKKQNRFFRILLMLGEPTLKSNKISKFFECLHL